MVHHTEDGVIHLEVTRSERSRWLARYWGPQLEGSWKFRSFRGAERWLKRSFTELFPEHCCGDECREVRGGRA
jgi:hypothetical protein